MEKNREIKIALAGNPNSGKSTIFNALVGARQTVGNFPGVTVDRYEGHTRYEGYELTFIDLPGTYSLSAYSDEERVAAEYLNHEKPDVIVNIVDASCLERNLYLTLLLKELGKPMFVVLNMIDVAKRHGVDIDVDVLSKELELPVVSAVGNRGVGMADILKLIIQTANQGTTLKNTEGQKAAEPEAADTDGKEMEPDAAKAGVERQTETTAQAEYRCPSCTQGVCCDKCRTGMIQTVMDVARYKEINRICTHSVRSMISLENSHSDRIDNILANKYLGIPIFLLAMYVVFQLTFLIGQYPMDWIEAGFDYLAEWIKASWPEGQLDFLKSLLIDGVIGGVGGVLVFLPNILILFLAITILEDSGYMARAALLCDRWMHKIGLHGRSIVPMLVGFGCTIPALMATKMLTNRKERLTTMFILPLFSCGARFPIYALLIPAFFPLQWRGPVLWAIYLIGILLAIIIAKLLSLFFKTDEDAAFIIELPPYHCPTFRTVGLRTLERGWMYIRKAATVILGISIILWFLTNYPGLPEQKVEEFENQRTALMETITDEAELEEKIAEVDNEESQAHLSGSYAGQIGSFIEPALRPMGFDWKIGTALIGAFAAKEVFVAQMGIVYSLGEDVEDDSSGLAEIMAKNYSPLVGFCIMLFCLIATPCMVTFIIMAKESGSWNWAIAQWLFLTGLAWVITTLVYQIGKVFLG